MMNIYRNILTAVLACMAVSCSEWTEPKHLDFYRPGPGEENPEEYAEYLRGVREFKDGEHKIMIVTMEGTSAHPSSQRQHLTAMPDSADYICVRVPSEGLHPEIAKEIPAVREKKGTKSLLYVDYSVINTEWSRLQDEKADKGEPAGTEQQAGAFFSESAHKQLDHAEEYGFDGLYVSYQGNANTEFGKLTQEAYMTAVKEFSIVRPGLELIFRGSARNIVDKDFLGKFKYICIVAGSEKKLTTLVTRILGYDNTVPSDRVIVELTVPSVEEPEQVGPSAAEGAQWVVNEADNSDFTPHGLSISNADEDYFNKKDTYYNVRSAIRIMNK